MTSISTIDFVCTPLANSKNIDVQVLINGASPSGELVDISGVIFGGPYSGVSYDLYTCSCGVSGCAGFHIPLEQTRTFNEVVWQIEDEKLSKLLGTQRLVFEAGQFDQARATLRASLEAYAQQGLHASSLQSWDYDENDQEITTYMSLAEVEGHQAPYFQAQVRMTLAKLAAADPANPAMVRTAYYDESGQNALRPFTCPAVDTAAILLNMGEALREEDKERAACLPQAAAIVRAFVADHDAAKAEDAFAPLRRFLAEDGIDAHVRSIFHTDAQGPLVITPF